jgi:hypothetical protein
VVDGARLRHLMCQSGVVKRPNEGAIHHITVILNAERRYAEKKLALFFLADGPPIQGRAYVFVDAPHARFFPTACSSVSRMKR